MAFQISDTLEALSERVELTPQIVVKIDGITSIYSTMLVGKKDRYGDGFTFGSGHVYGQLSNIENQKPIITFGSGGSKTTTQIFQQMDQESSGSSSTSTFQIQLINRDNAAVDIITPGVLVDDILSRSATVFFAFKGASFPEDYIRIFRGKIVEVLAEAGAVILTIAHPENDKRREAFQSVNTSLLVTINNSQTTGIRLKNVADLLTPTTDMLCYVRIEDELIRYTGFNSTTGELSGVTRGTLSTTAVSHDADADISTFYVLSGNGIDLALKIMISDPDNLYFSVGTAIASINVSASGTITNAVFFEDPDIQDTTGCVVGDYVTITGSGIGGNNVTNAVIASIEKLSNNTSYIVINQTITNEADSPAVIKFKSKYNVLSDGLGIDPSFIDIEEHEAINALFSAYIPEYQFYLKETMNCHDFINKNIYYPAGLYSIPRKARASIGITFPPFTTEEVKILDDSNITNVPQLTIKRSLSKNFRNAVVYNIDERTLDNEFKKTYITYSADSQTRIDTKTKALYIDCGGLRQDIMGTDTIIELASRRILDRYQFGAEHIAVKTLFKVGFTLEIGDIVIFGAPELKLPDIKTGDTDFQPRLMEVTNKKTNLSNGETEVELTDTSFDLDSRYCVISPSSDLKSGSTTTILKLNYSYDNSDGAELETNKWKTYVGQLLRVHSTDFTYSQTCTLVRIDTAVPNQLIVDGLSTNPGAGYIVDLAPYWGTIKQGQVAKSLHGFYTPQIPIVGGYNATSFVVGAGDVSKLFVGSFVRIHNYDYSVDSIETTVTNITGTDITVKDPLGFTPDSTMFIDLIGFSTDEGLPYRYI